MSFVKAEKLEEGYWGVIFDAPRLLYYLNEERYAELEELLSVTLAHSHFLDQDWHDPERRKQEARKIIKIVAKDRMKCVGTEDIGWIFSKER